MEINKKYYIVLALIGLIILIPIVMNILQSLELPLTDIPFNVRMDYVDAKNKYYREDGFYALMRCKFNDTTIYELEKGFVLGSGSFDYYDKNGDLFCYVGWSIDCRDGCPYQCPYLSDCEVISYGGVLKSEQDAKNLTSILGVRFDFIK